MTPIHHLRMSHQSDPHESCILMLPVSKHDTHLSPMERGQWWVIIFWGRGTRIITPIHHLRMSHHSDAHETCALMVLVSKHDAHLSPMERWQWWVIIFRGRGTRVMTPIHHLRMSHHTDAHKSCTLMLPVSKHDTHLSPMERGGGAMMSHHFLGEGNLKHNAHLSP